MEHIELFVDLDSIYLHQGKWQALVFTSGYLPPEKTYARYKLELPAEANPKIIEMKEVVKVEHD